MLPNEKINEETLKQLFQKSADVHFQRYHFSSHSVEFITCDAMIDTQLLNEVIVPRVQLLCSQAELLEIEQAIPSHLHIPGVKTPETKEEIISLVYTGHVLLYFIEEDLLISGNIAKKPNRNPEETRVEVPVKGPRDNFIEDISVNIALLRKRLPTNSLCVEKFELGERSKTAVALLYFDDIASEDTLTQIRSQLNQVDTDIVFSGDLLMENINKSAKLFPRTDYTGRPDNAIQALARGRFIVLVDGSSYAVITPVNMFLLLKTSEDNEYPIFYSSFQRILRVASILIGLLLPAFWLALTTYHQNQLPLQLLATIVQANLGLPFPSAFEMLLMLGMFELFREAGLRLPSAIGNTIGVVGGIIIGDAAIRAGLTSPAMIVIIATSTIATYTLVNQSLVTAVSLLRFSFILLTAFFGLFGFYLSMYFTLLYLSSIRTFGVPYMNIAADLSWKNIQKTIFRLSPPQYKERPNFLDPKDKKRNKGVKK
ncbi:MULTISPECIES: spore germination protein [unclassified Sporosarcina]|uniref:spore germination protein n=1 Tax=unclassified Sporosarcina TaxID=2647733 RepID=UPI00203BC528|nr:MULTISPECIES: spore germination protein [unclassified Sporosarcina]GKV66375.1 spore germination protein [Sporosarcina sp. NCCP-2331]GLB56492.1 spore germination protein [Sporosarcina sp. NCCP-2378]